VSIDPTDALVLELLRPSEGEYLLVLDAVGAALPCEVAKSCGERGRVTVLPVPSAAASVREELGTEIGSGKVRVVEPAGNDLPGDPGEFHGACTRNGPYLWLRSSIVVAELRRVLAPGARLVVALDPPGSPVRRAASASGVQPLNRIDIRRLLESEGLRVLRAETSGGENGDLHVMLAVRMP